MDEIVQEGIKIYSPKTITIESPEKVEILSPGEYYEYKHASLGVKLNDISFNLSAIGINPFGMTLGGLKLENRTISGRRIGGVVKWAVAGTDTEITTFKQALSVLTTFF